jgi:hypothetical protein
MTDQPTERRLNVTEADAMAAAAARDDYQWLVDNVFIPVVAQIVREERTVGLLKGSPLPRSRRPVITGQGV